MKTYKMAGSYKLNNADFNIITLFLLFPLRFHVLLHVGLFWIKLVFYLNIFLKLLINLFLGPLAFFLETLLLTI